MSKKKMTKNVHAKVTAWIKKEKSSLPKGRLPNGKLDKLWKTCKTACKVNLTKAAFRTKWYRIKVETAEVSLPPVPNKKKEKMKPEKKVTSTKNVSLPPTNEEKPQEKCHKEELISKILKLIKTANTKEAFAAIAMSLDNEEDFKTAKKEALVAGNFDLVEFFYEFYEARKSEVNSKPQEVTAKQIPQMASNRNLTIVKPDGTIIINSKADR